MSPLLVAASSALLLMCMHLSIDAGSVAAPPQHSQDDLEKITNRAGTEALNSANAARKYLKFDEKVILPEDLPSECHIHLACPLSVSGCNTAMNISKSLNELMYMYSSILGFPSDDDTDETELDFLEMVFFRFCIQMDRYLLHVENYTSQAIDRSTIQMGIKLNLTSPSCTRVKFLRKTTSHFLQLANATSHLDEFTGTSIYGYKFCEAEESLRDTCGNNTK